MDPQPSSEQTYYLIRLRKKAMRSIVQAIVQNQERQWQINQRLIELDARCDALQVKIQAEKINTK